MSTPDELTPDEQARAAAIIAAVRPIIDAARKTATVQGYRAGLLEAQACMDGTGNMALVRNRIQIAYDEGPGAWRPR